MRLLKLLLLMVFLFVCYARLLPDSSGFTQSAESGLAAPTTVKASDGDYSDKVGLNWDAIRNATAYRIFRNTTNDSASAVDIGTTAAATFFDTTCVPSQTYFYWVRAENGTLLSGLSTPDTGIRAVGQQGQPLNPPPEPPGNRVTAAKAYLGKALFWDEQLSSTQTVACGTCHIAGNGGSDPRTIPGLLRATNPGLDNISGTADDVYASPGVPASNADGTYSLSSIYGLNEQVTARRSVSFIDAGYSPTLFWDGRVHRFLLTQFPGQLSCRVGLPLKVRFWHRQSMRQRWDILDAHGLMLLQGSVRQSLWHLPRIFRLPCKVG